MKNKLILSFIILLICGIDACSQVVKEQSVNDKLIGKWKTTDSTSFRGKEIEFLPGQQVLLILAGGGEQNGQYEVNNNTIIFSIGDAPPFKMDFRFENDNLILSSLNDNAEIEYYRHNE